MSGRELPDPPQGPGAGSDPRLRGWQLRIFALCWLAYFLTYFGRTNLSVAMEALELWSGSGKAAVGFLGSLFFGVYAVGKLLNGYRGDLADNRRQIFRGLAVSGACNLGIGFADRLWIIMVLWALNGFAQSALWCNMMSLVSHWFYPEQRAGVAVRLSTSMVGGSLAGWGACGWLIGRFPWQWVFRVPGAILLGFALLWLALSRNRACDAGFAGIDPPPPPAADAAEEARQPLSVFWKAAGLIPVLLACLAQGVVKDGIGLWGPNMLGGIYGLDAGTASFLLLFVPVMNFAGITLTGAFQSRCRLSDEKVSILLMIAAMLCIWGLQASMGRSLMGGVLWLSAASAVMYGVNAVMLGVFPLRFAEYGRTSFVSGLLDFSSYLAAGSSSVFSGWIVDRGFGWGAVFAVWQGFTVAGLLALFWRQSRLRRAAGGGTRGKSA